MAREKYLTILFCVIPLQFVLCYCLDIAGDIKYASDAVVNEFNVAGEKISEAAKISSNAIVNEFNIAEKQISEAAKISSNAVVNEFNVAGEKISEAAEISSNAVVNEFNVVEEKISEAAKISSNAVVNEFNVVGEKISEAAEITSNAIVNEFNVAEEKISEAAKIGSNAVVNEFNLAEEKISEAAKIGSNAVVSEFEVIEDKTKKAVEAVVHELKQIKAEGYGCLCAGYSCGCCAHLEFPQIHLNNTGCVNLTYLAHDYGISFTVSIDNHTIYNETISVHNPPPICIDVPYLEKYAELCVRFYDLDATKTRLHGCVDVEARLYKVLVGHYNIGCFDIGKSTLGRWKKYHLQLIEALRSKQLG